HAVELRERHRVGAGAEQGERGSGLARQEIIALERQQLPELHRCPAEACEPLRETARIRGSQQRLRGGEALALREPANALHHSAERELSRREAEAEQSP